MIKVYIVDDHPYVREGLKAFLSTHDEIAIAGEAADGETALSEILQSTPDVAVVDLKLTGMNGIELTRCIKQANLKTQVIVMSSFCDDRDVTAAFDAGALSYLMKDSPPPKLIEAILAVKEGESVLHPLIVKKLMENTGKREISKDIFTAKEQRVLGLMVEGYSNKEIGGELTISETTVKTHVSNILHKLGVKDRVRL